MKTRFVACVLSLLLLGNIVLWAANESNWPRFRGPNGAGTADFNIPAKWSDDTVHWETKLPGTGHGSPVVWGDKIFLNRGPRKGKGAPGGLPRRALRKNSLEQGICLRNAQDEQTQQLRQQAPPLWTRTQSTWRGAITPELQVTALSHEGKQLWQGNFGKVTGGHGFGVSPIVHDDLVVLPNDIEKGGGFLLAIDRKTGANALENPAGQQAPDLLHPLRLPGP